MVEGGGVCQARHVGRRHKTQDSRAQTRDTKDDRDKASDTRLEPRRATQDESPTHTCLICNTPVSSAASLPHVLHACFTCKRGLHTPTPCTCSCRASRGLGALALLASGCRWWLEVE
jgi:hypothetical protein